MSDFIQSLDIRWSNYLGCQPTQLREGGRHVVPQPEWRSEERLPWPLTRGPVCLFTAGAGWVLSVPDGMMGRARRLCAGTSFQDLTAEGDQVCQDWFDTLGTENERERPGVEAYRVMCELVGRASFRGWSHYIFAYADPSTREEGDDNRVAPITEDNRNVWRQWQEWPGPFCAPKFAASFEVADAFGLVLDDRLVSVAQVQAHHAEYAWEFGVDTLPEFRGRGFATVVLKCVTRYIVNRKHVPYHYADAYNRASLRLPHKLGYRPYGEGLVAHPD